MFLYSSESGIVADMNSSPSPMDASTQTTLKRPQKKHADSGAPGGGDGIQNCVVLSQVSSSTEPLGTDVSHTITYRLKSLSVLFSCRCRNVYS